MSGLRRLAAIPDASVRSRALTLPALKPPENEKDGRISPAESNSSSLLHEFPHTSIQQQSSKGSLQAFIRPRRAIGARPSMPPPHPLPPARRPPPGATAAPVRSRFRKTYRVIV